MVCCLCAPQQDALAAALLRLSQIRLALARIVHTGMFLACARDTMVGALSTRLMLVQTGVRKDPPW
jgi:hypothetical protein